MLRLTVALLLIGACLAFNDQYDEHWRAFKQVHGKRYLHKQDVGRRAIFESNVKKINAHNMLYDLGHSSYRLGLNKFADMTSEEYAMYRGIRLNATAAPVTGQKFFLLPPIRVPETVDWRTKGYVTAVKDQGQCGSCWAFSTTGSLEGQNFKKTGKLVSLSEQNLVDCSGSFGNNGCGGGLMDNAFKYIKANGGIDTEDSYPYTATDGQCKFNDNAIGAKLTGFVDVPSKDEDALKKAVGTIGPVSVAIDAGNPSFQLYKDGVYDEMRCSPELLDHGVLAVGYGTTEDGKDYWLVKNSWGSSWGQSGYIQMSRNKDNQCGIATMASYPTA